jgi:acyl-CoA reductase-like NAD-dependent aldehyde dehydrogenase
MGARLHSGGRCACTALAPTSVRKMLGEAAASQLDDWREEAAEAVAAFKAWSRCDPGERAGAFASYRAALEREEQAGNLYRELIAAARALA